MIMFYGANRRILGGIPPVSSVLPTVNNKIIAELGQSNMEGRDGDQGHVDYPFTSTHSFWWDGAAPTALTTYRGGGTTGSHANYFAEKYYELKSSPVIMVEAAKGSTGLTGTSSNVGNWSASGTLRGEAEVLVDDALTYYSETTPFCALWCQGESDASEMDANGAYTKATVKAAMQSVIDWWFNKYPNAPFLISETGDISPYNNTTGWQNMRAVQNEIVAENEKVFMAFTGAKDFKETKTKTDGIHYNYLGLKDMGEAFATKLSEI
jgi:hypothetical protein